MREKGLETGTGHLVIPMLQPQHSPFRLVWRGGRLKRFPLLVRAVACCSIFLVWCVLLFGLQRIGGFVAHEPRHTIFACATQDTSDIYLSINIYHRAACSRINKTDNKNLPLSRFRISVPVARAFGAAWVTTTHSFTPRLGGRGIHSSTTFRKSLYPKL